jgi:hypothetical protein
MSDEPEVLLEAELAADPDADEELGPAGGEAIADEDIRGSRLLLVRRAAQAIQFDGGLGGAVELVCTFQPSAGTRFVWAQLRLRVTSPAGLQFYDIGPRDVRDDQPVQYVLDRKGKISLKYHGVGAEGEQGSRQEFKVYHCAVQGSGEGTSLARWDFNESPVRKDGLGSEQSLMLTLAATGRIEGHVSTNARLVRAGLAGSLSAIRDLVMGGGSGERWHRVVFEVPAQLPASGWSPWQG